MSREQQEIKRAKTVGGNRIRFGGNLPFLYDKVAKTTEKVPSDWRKVENFQDTLAVVKIGFPPKAVYLSANLTYI